MIEIIVHADEGAAGIESVGTFRFLAVPRVGEAISIGVELPVKRVRSFKVAEVGHCAHGLRDDVNGPGPWIVIVGTEVFST